MVRIPRRTCNSGFYHVINRGMGRQLLFEEDADYQLFLNYLNDCKEGGIELIAYCLMDNHFHLLISAPDGTSAFMHRLCTKYALYFNKKYNRAGHLFQNRYKSETVDDDQYFMTVIRYIHKNPQKARICEQSKYRWSSYSEYSGAKGICNTSYLYEMIGGRQNFESFSSNADEEDCMEFENAMISDTRALELIRINLAIDNGTELQNMTKEKRNRSIREMKNMGLSIRQIERITGISRGIIARA